ncbi:MAG: hypothetical protein HKN08_05220 [Gammaproteobacteria bacterium]|nr:hypothetical protein [Gammaproteobacteria bacterium]
MFKAKIICITFLLNLLVLSVVYAESPGAQWIFNVLLNDKTIGEHRFMVSPVEDDLLKVESNANMRVKILFFEAFKYTHQATEIWRDGCLESIEATTDNNNDMLTVNGMSQEQYFIVEATENKEMIEGCVKSFAYWDLSTILNAEKLLNSQTGEYIEIELIVNDWETVLAAGVEWKAKKYSLVGKDMHIDLWYGPNGEWIKLRSKLKNGRELVYDLQHSPAISI